MGVGQGWGRAALKMRALALLAPLLQQTLALTVENLRTEYLENPLGLDKPAPRFAWELQAEAGQRGVAQQSYRILVGDKGAADGSVWDSKVVASNASFQVKYAGPPLKSGAIYHWSVTVATSGSAAVSSAAVSGSATSPTAYFSMGMLAKADWGGDFIGTASPNASEPVVGQLTRGALPPQPPTGGAACPWFRKSFSLPASATSTGLLHVASVGYHELSVNGQPATDAVLLPSISYLPKRVLSRTYNVSALLKPGAKNAIGIWAATSWAEYPDLHHGISLDAPLVLAKLEVGSFSLSTDASWKTHASTTRHIGGSWGSSGFGGEAIDESKAIAGWDTAALDDSTWSSVIVHPLSSYSHIEISADAMEPTVKHSSIAAQSVAVATKGNPHFPPPPPGTWLVEMAEVYTGWFEVHNMHGAPGSTVHFQVSTTGGIPMVSRRQQQARSSTLSLGILAVLVCRSTT